MLFDDTWIETEKALASRVVRSIIRLLLSYFVEERRAIIAAKIAAMDMKMKPAQAEPDMSISVPAITGPTKLPVFPIMRINPNAVPASGVPICSISTGTVMTIGAVGPSAAPAITSSITRGTPVNIIKAGMQSPKTIAQTTRNVFLLPTLSESIPPTILNITDVPFIPNTNALRV